MGHHERRRTLPADEPPRTTPSEAVGESGDEEARREADEAERGRRGRAENPENAENPEDSAHGMSAKRQSPGLGREEQRRPLGRRGDAGDGAPDRS
ncbi:hypothetical protein [Streptomyces sp. NPDC085466]|uniref:hypothetical protein n=1 Tax=Streptomyces sp. NPDC085466 TaxID=3365725 RepID=UPI0037D987B5